MLYQCGVTLEAKYRDPTQTEIYSRGSSCSPFTHRPTSIGEEYTISSALQMYQLTTPLHLRPSLEGSEQDESVE